MICFVIRVSYSSIIQYDSGLKRTTLLYTFQLNWCLFIPSKNGWEDSVDGAMEFYFFGLAGGRISFKHFGRDKWHVYNMGNAMIARGRIFYEKHHVCIPNASKATSLFWILQMNGFNAYFYSLLGYFTIQNADDKPSCAPWIPFMTQVINRWLCVIHLSRLSMCSEVTIGSTL